MDDEPRYSVLTRSLAFAWLLMGAGPVTLSGQFLSVEPWILVLLAPILAVATILSVSGGWEARGKATVCCAVPSLVAGTLLAFVVAPILDVVADGFGTYPPSVSPHWRGIAAIAYALFLGFALVGPLQFIGRGRGTLRRGVFIVILAGIPSAVALYRPPGARPASLGLFLAAWILAAAILGLAEACRRRLELKTGLCPPWVDSRMPPISPAYWMEEDERRIGVAVSGGGYRASLFALGALMYVHETCCASSKPRRRVAALTSVSGGSITNGVLAHGLRLGSDDDSRFDALARLIIRHTVSSGSMFAGPAARVYYIFLLPVTVGALLMLGATAVMHASFSVLWRTVAIPIASVGLLWLWLRALEAASDIKRDWLGSVTLSTLLVAGLGGILWLSHFVLSDAAWRLALAWLGAATLAGAGLAVVWGLRGHLIQRNFETLLEQALTERASGHPRLADVHTQTHHVFCATEVQVGDTAYLAHDAIRSRGFKPVGPGRMPTAFAVRASAALPVAFPPAFLPGVEGKKEAGLTARGERRYAFSTDHMTLQDGGVRDNLGVSWFHVAPELEELVVVSAAANRHGLRRVVGVPLLGELQSLLNLVNIPYNSRERSQRRAVAVRLLGRPWASDRSTAAGAIIHIEDSPFDLAAFLLGRTPETRRADPSLDASPFPDWEVDQWLAADALWAAAGERTDVLKERSTAVREHLGRLEACLPPADDITDSESVSLYGATVTRSRRLGGSGWGSDAELAWWKRTQKSSLIGTKLSCLSPDEAKTLVMHGYYLAMANLHICAGWPLSESLDQARLDRLFAGLPKRAAARSPSPDTEAFLIAQERALPTVRTLLSVFHVNLTVRQAGRFDQKEAVVALALDSRGRIEPIGAWLAPSPWDLPHSTPRDYWRARAETTERTGRFWRDVFGQLKGRGLERVVVCCHDLPLHRPLASELFVPFDAAILATYPDVVLLPRVHGLVDDAAHSLTSSLEDSKQMAASLHGVIGAPDAAVARQRLELFGERWNTKHPHVHASWGTNWARIVRLFDYSPDTRQLLGRVDAAVQQTKQALSKALGERGAAATDVAGLSRLWGDLDRSRRTWKRVPRWKRQQLRIAAESRPH